jgi:hypothetical protein
MVVVPVGIAETTREGLRTGRLIAALTFLNFGCVILISSATNRDPAAAIAAAEALRFSIQLFVIGAALRP